MTGMAVSYTYIYNLYVIDNLEKIPYSIICCLEVVQLKKNTNIYYQSF